MCPGIQWSAFNHKNTFYLSWAHSEEHKNIKSQKWIPFTSWYDILLTDTWTWSCVFLWRRLAFLSFCIRIFFEFSNFLSRLLQSSWPKLYQGKLKLMWGGKLARGKIEKSNFEAELDWGKLSLDSTRSSLFMFLCFVFILGSTMHFQPEHPYCFSFLRVCRNVVRCPGTHSIFQERILTHTWLNAFGGKKGWNALSIEFQCGRMLCLSKFNLG